MTTFSQLVDELAVELVRPDMLGMIPGFLNATIREMHMHAQTNMPIYFGENRNEDLVTVSDASPETGVFLWDIPNVTLFQAMEAVYYQSVGLYVKQGDPRLVLRRGTPDVNSQYYWYRTGTKIAMAGSGGDGRVILVSWFQYLRSLPYYTKGLSRPLTFNIETQTYTQPQGATINLEEAMNLSTNWMLMRHSEALKEGVRAKAYRRMDNEFRASTAYSQFMAMRLAMQQTESYDMAPSYGS